MTTRPWNALLAAVMTSSVYSHHFQDVEPMRPVADRPAADLADADKKPAGCRSRLNLNGSGVFLNKGADNPLVRI
jgi:hypothetical protein